LSTRLTRHEAGNALDITHEFITQVGVFFRRGLIAMGRAGEHIDQFAHKFISLGDLMGYLRQTIF
jgi:hypothetical protein